MIHSRKFLFYLANKRSVQAGWSFDLHYEVLTHNAGLIGFTRGAADGEIGQVKEFYFAMKPGPSDFKYSRV